MTLKLKSETMSPSPYEIYSYQRDQEVCLHLLLGGLLSPYSHHETQKKQNLYSVGFEEIFNFPMCMLIQNES